MPKANAEKQWKDLEELQVFLVDNDQPTTRPICGARTDFQEINSWKQVHECLDCRFRFVGENEETVN